MLRKTLTILSLLGLLLSVGLWALSFGGFFLGYGDLQLELYDSGLSIIYWGLEKDSGWWLEGPLFEFVLRPTFSLPEIDTTGFLNRIPLLIPTVGFSLLLASCRPLLFHRRRKRKKLGLCVKCGYDLRASKERCPECGEAIG